MRRPLPLSARPLRIVTAVVIVLLVAGTGTSSAVAGTLDQQYVPSSGGTARVGCVNNALGQTFTAGATGVLDQVDLLLFAPAFLSLSTAPTGDLTITITAVDAGGLPVPLAGSVPGTIPASSAPASPGSWVSVAVNANIVAGTQYAITAVGSPTDGCWAWIGDASGTYAGGNEVFSTDNGATWVSSSGVDVGFKMYVAVATPACTWSRIKQPVNQVDGPSDSNISGWKAGTKGVIPAKFQLTCGGNLVDTQAEADTVGVVTLNLTKLSGADAGTEYTAESLVTGSANTGLEFRFDDTSDLYVYNIGVKSLTSGVFEITIDGGGSTQSEFFMLT